MTEKFNVIINIDYNAMDVFMTFQLAALPVAVIVIVVVITNWLSYLLHYFAYLSR